MPSVKETTQEAISHLSYHWFWGLRYSSVVLPGNLSKGLNALTENPTALKTLQDKQALINQRSLMIRLFYRLFNIKNYAADAYQLAAVEAMKERTMLPMPAPQTYYFSWARLEWAMDAIYRYCFTKTNESKKTENDDEVASVMGTSSVVAPSPISSESRETPPSPKTPDGVAQEEMPPYETALVVISKSKTQPSPPSVEDNPTFKVTHAMLPHLATLGVHKARVDNELTWSTVRSAYRKRALQQYPDKEGGTNEGFLKITEALDALKELIFSENDEELLEQSGTWEQYMHRRIDKLMQGWEKIRQKNNQSEAALYEIREDYSLFNLRLDRLEKMAESLYAPEPAIRQSRPSAKAIPIKPMVNIHRYFSQTTGSPKPTRTSHRSLKKHNTDAKVRPIVESDGVNLSESTEQCHF